jgi:ribosomal protein S18 acetylase RimI-like enzyme
MLPSRAEFQPATHIEIEEPMTIRPAEPRDHDAIWAILEPVIRAGETYTLPRDLGRDDGLAYWFKDGHEVLVAEENGANQDGGGSHVANCGYMTASNATGRGIAGAMCADSLERARRRGFRAMQFNFVVSTNERAVRLWQRFGFAILCTLPNVFLLPKLGYVDAYVMFRDL